MGRGGNDGGFAFFVDGIVAANAAVVVVQVSQHNQDRFAESSPVHTLWNLPGP
jgi:hypothetical protein